MIVSRIRKNGPVGRSHGFRTALLRTWVGINTDDIPKRRNIIDRASADKSCVELLEEPGFAAMPDNRRD